MAQTADALKAGAAPGAAWLSRKLGRRTTSGEFIPVIDGLRFVAISLVLLLHVTTGVWVRDPAVGDAAGFDLDVALRGSFGVQLFFVISGLILGIPFARRLRGGPPVRLRRYYLRRLTRLEPPYLLALTAFFVVNPLFGYGTHENLLPHYISGLFYAHGFVYHTVNPVNEVTWSLEIEVQFYMLMPLLATVFLVSTRAVRRGLLTAGIVVATAIAHLLTVNFPLENQAGETLPLAFLSLPGHLNLFLLGMLLADMLVHDWDGAKASVLADLAFVVGLTGLLLTDPYLGPGRTLLVPVSCVLVVAGGIRGRLIRRALETSGIFVIGGMCYSVYLLHFGIIRLIGDPITESIALSPPIAEFLVSTVVLTAICLIVSGAYYLLVERPCMWPDWPQRFNSRIRRAAAPRSPDMGDLAEAHRSDAVLGLDQESSTLVESRR